MQLQSMRSFVRRFPWVGPALWMVSFQYYLAQIIAARAWTTPYSLSRNTISDLGNTVCGLYNGRAVCSPLHALMNASFICLGITMTIGAVLIFHEFRESRGTRIGFGSMALAGIGTILVGIFAENEIIALHIIGATLPFVIGNLGIAILGFSLSLPRWLRTYTIVTGVLSLVAVVLWGQHIYLGLGVGGMERVVAYPQTIWLIVFGMYVSMNRATEMTAAQKTKMAP
jgi:hypothetical membrane protein